MRCTLLVLHSALAFAQPMLVNPGFDEPWADGAPAGWKVSGPAAQRLESGCKSGTCLLLEAPSTIEQTIPAPAFANQVLLFQVQAKGGTAALAAKVKNALGDDIYFDSTLLRSNRSAGDWSNLTLAIPVTPDAASITISLNAHLGGSIFDSLSFSIPPFAVAKSQVGFEGPSPLNRTALNNLVAYARLIGVIRHFHPSDQAADADWMGLTLDGVRKLDYAIEPESFARRLNDLFRKVAPAVKAYVGNEPELALDLRPEGKKNLVRWSHEGLVSKRVSEPARPLAMHTVNVWRGLKARVPLELFSDAQGTLPHTFDMGPLPAPMEVDSYSGDDRATRLANVILAWNTLKYFHPDLDVLGIDWDASLVRALQRAAVDKDATAFSSTLEEMVGPLGARVHLRAAKPREPERLPPFKIFNNGIAYADPSRLSPAEWQAAMPTLAASRAVVIDLRGELPPDLSWLGYLTRQRVKTLSKASPIVEQPDRKRFTEPVIETIEPREPHWTGQCVFLSGPTTMGSAEEALAVVEAYRLGEIVGQPSAGAPGIANSVLLPGNYRIHWPALKTLKQDGKRIVGIGIPPTVATQSDALERALTLLK